jgi:hypothetical protein
MILYIYILKYDRDRQVSVQNHPGFSCPLVRLGKRHGTALGGRVPRSGPEKPIRGKPNANKPTIWGWCLQPIYDGFIMGSSLA